MADKNNTAYAIVHYDSQGGMQQQGPIVSGTAPSYNEIVVDPNGVEGGYLTIQAALDYASSQATSTSPWTVRLLPGTYTPSGVLSLVSKSYVSIIGAGSSKTIITRSTALGNSSTPGRGTDPILDLSASDHCRVEGLTLKHTGVFSSGFDPCGIAAGDATNLKIVSCRIESTDVGIDIENTALPTQNSENSEVWIRDSEVIITNVTNTSADGIYLGNHDVRLENTNTLIETSVNGPDVIFSGKGRLVIIGGEHVWRATNSSGTTINGRVLVIVPGSGGTTAKVYALGARFYMDFTRGDLNSATTDARTIHINASTTTGGDWDLSLVGCKVDRESGTLTSARSFNSLEVGATNAAGTLGTTRLIGTELRDLGGSGATNRQDVDVVVASSGGVKQSKAVYVTGGRVASWFYRSSLGTPSVTHTAMMATEPTANYQTGTATFPSGATVSVTLPVAYPAMGTSVTDYTVAIEPSANETFWVTSKTNTTFIANSSNAASSAVVRYVVQR